jgi:nucleotide-binding universal stress UspA family protein
VELLSVVDPAPLADFAETWKRSNLDQLIEEETQATVRYLEATAASFSGADIVHSVQTASPAEAIINKAQADPSTLLVMVTHGRSGMQRRLLGSVAEKVLHETSNHLLLVRAAEENKTDGVAALKTIVVPLDGSALAEQAIAPVEDLARKLSLDVVLMRVYVLPSMLSLSDYGRYTLNLVDRLAADAQRYLEMEVDKLKRKGIDNVSAVTRLGYAADEIIEFARKTPDNMIAMCTHGRSGVRRWLLGSVTERVVRHSGDPVLIVQASSA